LNARDERIVDGVGAEGVPSGGRDEEYGACSNPDGRKLTI
jgi:hypothetical protein